MRRVIKFHLTGRDAEYAIAFENHCTQNLGVVASLDEIIKRHFLKFVYDAAAEGERLAKAGSPASSIPIPESQDGAAENTDGTQLANSERDTAVDAVPPEGADRPAEEGSTSVASAGV